MFKKILLALLVLIVAFLVVVALQPSEFAVSRSATISAPPDVVFEQVNDLHKFNQWNPWAKIDPDMKQDYDGPESGVGSSYAWDGDRNVGAGKMTITESTPHELVVVKLEFFRPMAGVNDTRFVLKPVGEKTELTWSMSGKVNFVGKAFHLFMDMDEMIGGMYEQGFANLEQIVARENSADESAPLISPADDNGAAAAAQPSESRPATAVSAETTQSE